MLRLKFYDILFFSGSVSSTCEVLETKCEHLENENVLPLAVTTFKFPQTIFSLTC